MFDALLKGSWFLLTASVCWCLLYSFSSYNPNKPNAKYITIPNKTLAKILISKRNLWLKYVKVKDRNKLYLPCFLGYIIALLILIISLIMVFLPPIPCDPIIFPTGRRGHFILDTYNEKIPLLLIFLLFVVVFLCVLFSVSFRLFTKKDKSITIGSKIFVIFILFLFLLLAGYVFIMLI